MIKEGDIIEATVTGITDYGFFITTDNNYTGLCHISEIANSYVSDITKYVNISDIIYVYVIEVNGKHLKVSIKDINYKGLTNSGISETRRGFLPLKNMLPIWIQEKMQEYKKS